MLFRSLEEIVWAVRPGSDTLQSLVDYLVHFANETFSAGNTRCRLDFPPDLPAQGGGEPAIVPMGAVLANAVFDATGARLKQLPMTPARIVAAMKTL